MQTRVTLLPHIDRDEFNRLVPNPMQTYEWGEARKQTGVQVVRFGEYDGDTLVAVFQMTLHKVPGVKRYVGYIPRSVVPSDAVVSFIYNWAEKEKVIFIKWEPYVEADSGEPLIKKLAHMRKSPHPLFPEWNQEVDITGTEEQIVNGFHQKNRYSIRHGERLNLEVKEMNDDEGFKIFSDLYFGTVDRQKYHGHTRRYHKIVWDALRPTGIAHIFIVFYEGRPLAAFEIFFWHDRAYYPYGGTADADRNIPGAHYLMWKVIQTAKQRGAKVFDMWGSLPPDFTETHPKHPWFGFTFFKRRFGTRFVRMTPSYDLVVNTPWYHLYNVLYTLRKLVWKSGVV